MISADEVPDVEADEVLARFVFSRRHIRNNGTIKPEAFIPPPPDNELSVTRHRDATEEELWGIGRAIATVRGRTLHGRGDITSRAFLDHELSMQAAPVTNHASLPDNPNHAIVIGWPDDKPRQKLIALDIARQARLSRPTDP